VPICELAGTKTTQRERASLDLRGFRKELEHPASIETPMQELLLT
jgi:hypothetical protein